MIARGSYEPWEGFEMEITASEPQETEEEKMIKRCNKDIRRAVDEGCLEVETPRGHVEQDALQNLAVTLRYPTETIWPRGSPETTTGPPLLGLQFRLEIDHEDITTDLSSMDTDVIVYGDQHVWRLADPWESEVVLGGMHIGEPATYQHDHEWGTAEEIDWRY